MEHATIVIYNGKVVSRQKETTYVFCTTLDKQKEYYIWVQSYKDGIVKLDPMIGFGIDKLALIVSGCFNKYSNFSAELKKVFLKEKKDLEKIVFKFNDVPMVVTKTNSDSNLIVSEWEKRLITYNL